jgi:predicted phosphodiesterase
LNLYSFRAFASIWALSLVTRQADFLNQNPKSNFNVTIKLVLSTLIDWGLSWDMQTINWSGILKLIKKLRPLGIIITAVLGACLALYTVGPSLYTFEGLTFSVSTLPAAKGGTTIDLSPLGSISAATHQLPLELKIKLHYIGTGAITQPTLTSIDNWNRIYEGLINNIKPFIVKQLLIIFFAAVFSVLLIWRSRLSTALISGLACSLLMALLLIGTYQSYQAQALREPVYCGIIALAPQVIPDPGKIMDRLEEIQADTRKIVGNISVLMSNSNGLAFLSTPIEENAFKKVLLISDLHSNPLGVQFIKEISSAFQVDLILDAGDLTDLGTSLEAEYGAGISSIKTPYVFCPGNHDTPEIIDFVKNLDNATVLEGGIVDISGIRILGAADPLSASKEVEMEDALAWEKLMQERVSALRKSAQEEELPPHLLVVHHPKIAQQLAEDFPLIVYGHTHQQSIKVNKDSIMLNPGTSGAAGLRGLYAKQAVPYSAMVLYLNDEGLAAAVDTVKYEPFSDRFYIERKLLHPSMRKPQVFWSEDPLAEEYEIHPPDEKQIQALEDDLDQEKL